MYKCITSVFIYILLNNVSFTYIKYTFYYKNTEILEIWQENFLT